MKVYKGTEDSQNFALWYNGEVESPLWMRGYLNDLEAGRYGYGIASSVDFFVHPEEVTQWREMLWTGTGWGWQVSDAVQVNCPSNGAISRTRADDVFYDYEDDVTFDNEITDSEIMSNTEQPQLRMSNREPLNPKQIGRDRQRLPQAQVAPLNDLSWTELLEINN